MSTKDPRNELEEKIRVRDRTMLEAYNVDIDDEYHNAPSKDYIDDLMQAVDNYVAERERLARANGQIDEALFWTDLITDYGNKDISYEKYETMWQNKVNELKNTLQAERKDGV